MSLFSFNGSIVVCFHSYSSSGSLLLVFSYICVNNRLIESCFLLSFFNRTYRRPSPLNVSILEHTSSPFPFNPFFGLFFILFLFFVKISVVLRNRMYSTVSLAPIFNQFLHS